MGPLDRAEDERLVLALRAGDQDAFGRLFDRWYDRVHELARRITRDDALAADVAQDAFLSAWQRLDRLDDPASFGGWLLRIARNRALDVVRAPAHTRTQADEDVSTLVDEAATGDRLVELGDPADVAGDREVQELIWSAAATLGERDLTALDLSLRHGLEPGEIGEVLGINRNAANQLVHRMRGRLATAIGSRVLWRGGQPACADLRAALAADGSDEFDARAVRVADRHAGSCEACTRRRESRLDPAQLFASVPVIAAPILLKAKAAAALEAAGVPMGGSTGGSMGTGSGSGASGAADVVAADPPRQRRRPSRRTVALGAVALVVIALVVAVLAVESLDHDGLTVAAEGAVGAPVTTEVPQATTTTEGGRITVEVVPDPTGGSTAPDATDPVATPDPGSGDPPPVVPPPPPPPPAAPSGSVSVSPPSRPPTVPASAETVVSWTSANGTSVSISGPGLSSGAASGSQRVCPGSVITAADGTTYCVAPAGTYTYTLTVTGPGGTVQRSATLTVS
jgi:RNA polymerase sigma factor (sigma-70 family)